MIFVKAPCWCWSRGVPTAATGPVRKPRKFTGSTSLIRRRSGGWTAARFPGLCPYPKEPTLISRPARRLCMSRSLQNCTYPTSFRICSGCWSWSRPCPRRTPFLCKLNSPACWPNCRHRPGAGTHHVPGCSATRSSCTYSRIWPGPSMPNIWSRRCISISTTWPAASSSTPV
ncbi:hypothetical protein D3C75_812650 [compost metagenome]